MCSLSLRWSKKLRITHLFYYNTAHYNVKIQYKHCAVVHIISSQISVVKTRLIIDQFVPPNPQFWSCFILYLKSEFPWRMCLQSLSGQITRMCLCIPVLYLPFCHQFLCVIFLKRNIFVHFTMCMCFIPKCHSSCCLTMLLLYNHDSSFIHLYSC